MKHTSLFTALAFALLQTGVESALSVDFTEPTRSNDFNGAFFEKVWTVSGDNSDIFNDMKVQVAGNVFVDYDASLRAADGVKAKVIMRSSSPDMVDLVDVTVHEADGSGVRVHYKNANARVVGEVVTQIIVGEPNVLSSVSAMNSDNVVLGDGVVVSNDPSASLEFDASSEADIFVGSSLTQDQFTLKDIDIASSGDGHVQVLASSIQADSITVSLSGDSKAAIIATDHITVDSMVSAISGNGKIFVETANFQSQKLSATLSGDGKVSYSSAGSCVDQTIHLSGDAAVYAGSIVCKNSMVATSGDGKAIVQTTDTLTSVGGGSVKYVNSPPHRVVSSSIFRKHSNVKLAKYNKFKTRRPSLPPTRAPTYLTIAVKAAWFGDSPHVSVYSGIGNPIVIDDTGFAVTGNPSSQNHFGLFGVFTAVGVVAAIAFAAFKFRERRIREKYESLA